MTKNAPQAVHLGGGAGAALRPEAVWWPHRCSRLSPGRSQREYQSDSEELQPSSGPAGLIAKISEQVDCIDKWWTNSRMIVPITRKSRTVANPTAHEIAIRPRITYSRSRADTPLRPPADAAEGVREYEFPMTPPRGARMCRVPASAALTKPARHLSTRALPITVAASPAVSATVIRRRRTSP
jgi:hypothetical protein